METFDREHLPPLTTIEEIEEIILQLESGEMNAEELMLMFGKNPFPSTEEIENSNASLKLAVHLLCRIPRKIFDDLYGGNPFPDSRPYLRFLYLSPGSVKYDPLDEADYMASLKATKLTQKRRKNKYVVGAALLAVMAANYGLAKRGIVETEIGGIGFKVTSWFADNIEGPELHTTLVAPTEAVEPFDMDVVPFEEASKSIIKEDRGSKKVRRRKANSIPTPPPVTLPEAPPQPEEPKEEVRTVSALQQPSCSSVELVSPLKVGEETSVNLVLNLPAGVSGRTIFKMDYKKGSDERAERMRMPGSHEESIFFSSVPKEARGLSATFTVKLKKVGKIDSCTRTFEVSD